MRLYASTFPDDVAGLVLVDPTPATFIDDACAIVDESACESMGAEFEPSRGEGLDIVGSADVLSAAGPLPAVPLVVLDAEVGEVSDGERSRVDQRRTPLAETSGEALVGDAAIQHLSPIGLKSIPTTAKRMK